MQHTLTMNDNKKTVTVQKGDTIEIELDENMTTGFNWDIDKADENICELVASEYQLPANSAMGGGGVRTMIFRVKNTGTASIRLKNWQRWSGSIYQNFEVTVKAS